MSFEADLSASLSGEAGDGRHGSPTGAELATRSQPRSRSAGVGYENAVDAEGRRVIWLNRAVVDRSGAAAGREPNLRAANHPQRRDRRGDGGGEARRT